MSEWISVKEPPKDEHKRVLVAVNNTDLPGCPGMDTDRFVNGRWVRWNGRVTYWMELPELPVVVAENATAS